MDKKYCKHCKEEKEYECFVSRVNGTETKLCIDCRDILSDRRNKSLLKKENEESPQEDEEIQKKRESKSDGIEQREFLAHRQLGVCRGPKRELDMGYICPLKRTTPFRYIHQELGWENDHRIRHADGGSNELFNRQLLCPGCHRYKTLLEKRKENELTQQQQTLLIYFQTEYNESETRNLL
tara:strand:+ start:133 stop:675 length:543 start_codon:yes stop_codon:yes gene_type:complete